MPDEPLTITAAAPLIRTGELTPSELLEQCLRRVDVYEPHVKAWVYLDRERARRDAQKLTDDVKGGNYRGPLHGIPIGIKDIIDVFDMPTGCGSKLWANSYARRDATVVERLRQAGAIILGKTVTTPYAFTDPPVTRNPWNLNRTPGGSSSGSAAAVACGMCLGALGTQTGGSLTRPASYCGVYSLKPTFRRVSLNGVLPLAPDLDHLGVLANCVRDLASIFEVIAGADGDDSVHLAIPAATYEIDNILKPNKESRPKFTRLHGLFEERADPETNAVMQRLAHDLRSLSIAFTAVRESVPPAAFAELPRHHRTIMAVQAASYHGQRMMTHPDDYPERIRELIEFGRNATATDYNEACSVRRQLHAQIDDPATWSGTYLTPAATGTAPSLDTTGDPIMNVPWSFTGLPTVSLPLARSAEELPMSVQLTGSSDYEEYLLASAAWVERCLNVPRRLPPVPA